MGMPDWRRRGIGLRPRGNRAALDSVLAGIRREIDLAEQNIEAILVAGVGEDQRVEDSCHDIHGVLAIVVVALITMHVACHVINTMFIKK